MNQPATLHRLLCLIRWLRPPHPYPTAQALVDQFIEAGFTASTRTFDRDKASLRDQYGVEIKYDRQKKGYYLDLPTDESLDDFREFVQLLERRERLEFLSSAIEKPGDISRYLLLENNEQFVGAEHLPLLWEALRSGRVVTFRYGSYARAEMKTRTVEPGLIFEYRNRWYLDGWDTVVDQMRTFGLDRMHDLALTAGVTRQRRTDQYRAYRTHAIGVTCQPDQVPERVVLRFTAQEGQYIKSLPLHSSQRLLEESSISVDVELTVILNHELEREILAYGEEVEVREPAALRERLAKRVEWMSRQYSSVPNF